MTLNWGQRGSARDEGAAGTFDGTKRTNRIADLRRSKARPWVSYVSTAFGKSFDEYCSSTKVNGPYYWQKGVTTGRRGRIIWIIIPAALMIMGLFLVFSLWQRYLASPTRMTIGQPLMVVEVPFPAVSICHPRTVVEYKARDFADRVKYPPGVTKERLLEALPTLGILNEHQWNTLPDGDDVLLVNNVLALNNISMFSAATQLGKTCEDFLVECRFAGQTFPCFQRHQYLSWTTTTSHYGTCCSFHYNPLTDGFHPFAANTFGSEGGLTVVASGYPLAGKGISGNMYSNGLVALIHHPLDYALETSQTVLLPHRRETFVAVHATDLRCSEQVLALPEEQRNCINPADYRSDEIRYRQSTCILGCLREAIRETCGCHPYFLPERVVYGRTKKVRECQMIDGICLAQNYGKFKLTQCNCLPLCNDVSYKVNSFATDIVLSSLNRSVSSLYRSTNMTDFEFIAHFYMAKQIVPTNKRIVVMSWITLLSNLGGVFSLCMGISVISLIEIVYFLGIRVRYHYVQDQQKRADQLRQATRNVAQVLQLATAKDDGERRELPSPRRGMMTRHRH